MEDAEELAPIPSELTVRTPESGTSSDGAAVRDRQKATWKLPEASDPAVCTVWAACSFLPGAIAVFDEALRHQPDHPGTLYMRAQVKGALGDVPGMRADLERALDVAPADWPQRAAAEDLLRSVPR